MGYTVNDGLTKPPFKLEHGWVITSHCFTAMYLLFHTRYPKLRKLVKDAFRRCWYCYVHTGGIWRYTEQPRDNQGATAFHNLTTNSCRETTAFSDFPCPHHFPQYMSHRDFLKYLRSYANHFRLLEHIRFKTRILRVWPTENFIETGRWNVAFKCHIDGEAQTLHEVFDSVFVCSGLYKVPVFPDIPGRDNFRGEVIHMWHYRHPRIFNKKRVLVVGEFCVR